MIESGKEVLANILYIPSSDTHIITYKGEFKKGFFLKDLAREIIGVFGDPFISTVAEIPAFIFLMIWVLLFLLLILMSAIFELVTSLLLFFFFLGIILKDLRFRFFTFLNIIKIPNAITVEKSSFATRQKNRILRK